MLSSLDKDIIIVIITIFIIINNEIQCLKP